MIDPTRPISPLRAALREPRLWVALLWALGWGVTAGALHWGDALLARRALAERVVLLPRQPLEPSARDTVRDELRRQPVVAAARWLSPADQARRVERRFPDARAADLLPAGDAWLPWLLELQPLAPLARRAELEALVARLERDGEWDLFWNPAALVQLERDRRALWSVGALMLALTFLAGLAALLHLPPPAAEGRGWRLAITAILGAFAPLAVGSAASISGLDIPPASLAIGAGCGLLLAALLAPMLRVRIRPRPTPHSLSLAIGEGSDERIR